MKLRQFFAMMQRLRDIPALSAPQNQVDTRLLSAPDPSGFVNATLQFQALTDSRESGLPLQPFETSFQFRPTFTTYASEVSRYLPAGSTVPCIRPQAQWHGAPLRIPPIKRK